jgi:neutral ceramidase
MRFTPLLRRWLPAICLLLLITRVPVFAQLRLGMAAVDITPKAGTPMAGYYYERGAEGAIDPLYARALVLDDGRTRVALVALDLISTVRWFVEDARKLIERDAGIPGANVMISASHAHTGPVFARTNSRYDDLGGGNPLAVAYTDTLAGRIAEAVKRAASAMQPVQISHGAGQEDGLAWNRRFFMRDGSVGWNPGKLNPEIVRPAGPTDPEVPLLYFTTPKAQPVACYVNFAVHLDIVGGSRFSADMPGFLARHLADARGSNFFTFYTTGTCGDINHINVNIARPQGGVQEAARMGTILAANVLKTIDGGLTAVTNNLELRVRSEILKLPLAPVTPAEIEWAGSVVKRTPAARNASRTQFMDLVRAYKILDVMARDGRPLEVEVQVISLGDQIAWVSLPGEIFVRLGLDIKQRSPYARTFIAELANGSIGYIPDRAAWPQGNYEVESARCAEGSGEMLVDSALHQLRELHRQAVAPNPSPTP